MRPVIGGRRGPSESKKPSRARVHQPPPPSTLLPPRPPVARSGEESLIAGRRQGMGLEAGGGRVLAEFGEHAANTRIEGVPELDTGGVVRPQGNKVVAEEEQEDEEVENEKEEENACETAAGMLEKRGEQEPSEARVPPPPPMPEVQQQPLPPPVATTLTRATERLTERLTERIAEPLAEHLSERLSERLSEQLAEPLAEPLTDLLTMRLTERLTERLAERLTERLTERLSESARQHAELTRAPTRAPKEPSPERSESRSRASLSPASPETSPLPERDTYTPRDKRDASHAKVSSPAPGPIAAAVIERAPSPASAAPPPPPPQAPDAAELDVPSKLSRAPLPNPEAPTSAVNRQHLKEKQQSLKIELNSEETSTLRVRTPDPPAPPRDTRAVELLARADRVESSNSGLYEELMELKRRSEALLEHSPHEEELHWSPAAGYTASTPRDAPHQSASRRSASPPERKSSLTVSDASGKEQRSRTPPAQDREPVAGDEQLLLQSTFLTEPLSDSPPSSPHAALSSTWTTARANELRTDEAVASLRLYASDLPRARSADAPNARVRERPLLADAGFRETPQREESEREQRDAGLHERLDTLLQSLRQSDTNVQSQQGLIAQITQVLFIPAI